MNTRIRTLWIIVLALGFWLGSLLLLVQNLSATRFGILDVQALVSLEAQKAQALYPNNQLSPEKLQGIALHLRKRVEAFAKDKNIILLAQGAVWGGTLPDYTESVMAWLKTGDNPYAD